MTSASKAGVLIGLFVLLSQCCPPCLPTQGDLRAKSAKVSWTPANQSARTVSVGEHVSVGVGDSIDVDASGLAVLEFPDLLAVEIYRDSTLRVRETSSQGSSLLIDLYLTLGSIFASTEPNARSRLRVATGSATVESLTTEFLVLVDPGTQATTVAVDDGQVQVSGAGQTVTVQANHYTVVSPGQPPSPPESLSSGTFVEWLETLRGGEVPSIPGTSGSATTELPDLVVVVLQTTGAPTVNANGDVEVPLRVVVRNQGNAAAVIFKVPIVCTIDSKEVEVAFTVPGQGDGRYPYTDAPLAAGAKVDLVGKVVCPSSLRGQKVSLKAVADGCADDELVPAYCRVLESDEDNNESTAISILLP